MEDVLAAMGVEQLGRSQISALCQELDATATAFRTRELPQAYPYVWFDALYEKVRIDDRVVSQVPVLL